MGRPRNELLDRAEAFSQRMIDVGEALAKERRSNRIVDQIIGAGTSVGANTWEAAEAMSRPDFCKTLGHAVEELSESFATVGRVCGLAHSRPGRAGFPVMK